MKSLERVHVFTVIAAVLLVSGFCLFHPALANIYAYSSDDGTVNLSNIPTDSRYTMLVHEPDEHTPSLPVTGPGKPPSNIASKIFYDSMVDEVAGTYGLESALLHAVISVESRYNPKAVSKKGAAGLMQLMPVITKRYGVADPFDPEQNLHGGAKYLRDLLKNYNNDTSLALAAYNAGETAVAKYGNRIPPFRETVNYVPRVLVFYRKYRSDLAIPDGKKVPRNMALKRPVL
jgi:hypothetical protein